MVSPNRQAVELAKRLIERDADAMGAVFALRDTEVVRRLGMMDVMWAMYQHGTVTSEVARYIEEIETALEAEDEGG